MFNIDWWNNIQATATDGPLTADYLQDGAVTEPALGTCAITQNKLGALSVTSCKLSTNALTRVLVIPFSKLASTEAAAFLTSANIIYQPIVPITITGIQVFPTGTWQNATCDHLTLFRNSSDCVGNVGFKSIASTASLWGVASCVGSITNAAVAANTVLTMKSNVSTCSVSSNATIVVHYTTTA